MSDQEDESVSENFEAGPIQTRSQNVVAKRNEQLKRWQTSDTNRESCTLQHKQNVHFHDSDIFMSACMSGDEREVEDLLLKGAHVDTPAMDGLTALHQAVIEGNLSMVKFLLGKGANINAQDHEGWTPLHAAACCNKPEIVRHLCDNNADLTLTNSDKDLPIHLAETEDLKSLFEQEYAKRSINTEECRHAEENRMLADARKWHAAGRVGDKPHPVTGASALHVAAAKGYIRVMNILLQAGIDIDPVDNDGWTPLHAAAHWGEKTATELLVEHGASLDRRSIAGQTPIDVADQELVTLLEDARMARPITPIGVKRALPDSAEPAPVSPKRHSDSIKHLPSSQKHEITLSDERRELEHFMKTQHIVPEEPEKKISKQEQVVPIALAKDEDPPADPPAREQYHRHRPTSLANAEPIAEPSNEEVPASPRVKMFAAPEPVTQEAEAERKARSKRERQSRRSTQGITAEQLAEAQSMSSTVRKSSTASVDTASTADDLDTCDAQDAYKITPILATHEPKTATTSIESSLSASEKYRAQAINATVIMPVEETVVNQAPLRQARKSSRDSSRPSNSPPQMPAPPTPNSAAVASSTAVPWRSRALEQAQSPVKAHSPPAQPTFAAQTSTVVSAQSVAPDNDVTNTPSASQMQRRQVSNRLQQKRSMERRATGPIQLPDKDETTSSLSEGGEPAQAATSLQPMAYSRTVIPINDDAPPPGSITHRTDAVNGYISANETLSGYHNRYPSLAASTSSGVSGLRVTSATQTANDQTPIDYRKLYETERRNNEKLLCRIQELEKALRLTRVSNGHDPVNNNNHVIVDNELEQLRDENERLKQENGALIRVISKLSK